MRQTWLMTITWVRRQIEARAREEAADVKPRQLQLDHLKSSFAGRGWQSPICPTYFRPPFPQVLAARSFQHRAWTNIRTFPHNSLRERCPGLSLGGGFSLSRKAISQASSARKLIPPSPQWQLTIPKGKKVTFLFLFFLEPLFFIHPRSVFLLYIHRHTPSCTLWWMSHICHPVSWVFLSCVSGQRCHSASFELSGGRAVKASH